MESPEAGWVEERSLSDQGARFDWRLDEAGNLTIRLGQRKRVFARAGLERLQAFMGDGEWHPASLIAGSTWADGEAGRGIAEFGRDELGWSIHHVRAAGLLSAVFRNAGAWVWDGRSRSMRFRQAHADLGALGAYYARRRAGQEAPRRAERAKVPRREDGPGFDLAATFRSLGQALRARIEAATTGHHRAEKGRRREGALRDFLREQLPPAFGVAQGEAVAADGQASRQTDVLIYDALRAPILLAGDSSVILAAESVYAGIEVKPILSTTALGIAAENLASLKALPSSAIMRLPGYSDPATMPTRNPAAFGAIFGFEGEAPLRLLDSLCALCKDRPPELWPEAIVVLDKAVIYRQGSRLVPLGWSAGYAKHRTPFLCVEAGANSLLLFYLMLLQDLNTKTLLPPDLMKYSLTLGLPEPTVRRP